MKRKEVKTYFNREKSCFMILTMDILILLANQSMQRSSLGKVFFSLFFLFLYFIESFYLPIPVFADTGARSILTPPLASVFVVQNSTASVEEPVTISYEDAAGASVTEEIIYKIEKRKTIYSDGRLQIESKGYVNEKPRINPETGTLTFFEGSYVCFEDKIAGGPVQRRGGRTLTVIRAKPQRVLDASFVENFSRKKSRYEYIIDGDGEYLLNHTGQLFESNIVHWTVQPPSGPVPPTAPPAIRRSYVIIKNIAEDFDPSGRILNIVCDLQKRKNTFFPGSLPAYDRLENFFQNKRFEKSEKPLVTAAHYQRTTRFQTGNTPKTLEITYKVTAPGKRLAIASTINGDPSGKIQTAWIKEYHDSSLVDSRLWLNRTPGKNSTPGKFHLTSKGISRFLKLIRSWEETFAANGQPVSPYAFPFEAPS